MFVGSAPLGESIFRSGVVIRCSGRGRALGKALAFGGSVPFFVAFSTLPTTCGTIPFDVVMRTTPTASPQGGIAVRPGMTSLPAPVAGLAISACRGRPSSLLILGVTVASRIPGSGALSWGKEFRLNPEDVQEFQDHLCYREVCTRSQVHSIRQEGGTFIRVQPPPVDWLS